MKFFVRISQISLIVLALEFFVAPAMARGGGREGGAGFFLIIDGRKIVADSYYKALGVEEYFESLGPEVQNYLKGMKVVLDNLGIQNDKFWDKYVWGSLGLYVWLDEQQEKELDCKKKPPYFTIPAQLTSSNPEVPASPRYQQFGCTVGTVSYLFKKKIFEPNGEPVSVSELARAVIHEKLWAFTQNAADERHVARFTTVLAKLVERRDDQWFRRDRRDLLPEFIAEIGGLQTAAEQLGFKVPEFPIPDRITSRGGGMILRKRDYLSMDHSTWCYMREVESGRVDSSSFIGIGTLVDACSNIKNSTLLTSLIKSTDISGSITQSSDYEYATITNAEIYGSKIKVTRVTHSTIENSTLAYLALDCHSSSPCTILGSELLGTPGTPNEESRILKGTIVLSSKIKGIKEAESIRIRIGEKAYVNGVSLLSSKFTEIEIMGNTWLEGLNLRNIYVGHARLRFGSGGRKLDFEGLECHTQLKKLEVSEKVDLISFCRK